MSEAVGVPTLLQDEEEVLGDPSFELLVRDGRPVVSGSYFIQPPLRAVHAEWDKEEPGRVLVLADDGSAWYADNVSQSGSVSVALLPVSGSHPAFSSPNSSHRRAD